MDGRSRWLLLLPEPIRRLPADLGATAASVLVTVVAVFAPFVSDTPLRALFGLAFVLFVPGYAFVAALFPEAGASPSGSTEIDGTTDARDEESETSPGGDVDANRSGIDGIERVALSFGTSIAIVPLLGLVLNFTPWGIRLVPVVVAVGGFTLAATAVAARRRWELPAGDRFAVPYRSWLASTRTELFEPDSRADAALNVLLVCSLLLAAGSVTYAVAVPKQGEAFTELYLLTEDDEELVADGYPENVTRGETVPLVVGVGNNEHRRVNYSLVVELQRVTVENNSTTVHARDELRRFSAALDGNETWHRQHSLRPTMTGERLRLQYLLYRGPPPAEPNTSNSYRENHIFVNVSESA